jgi:hypothetical protein
MRHAGPILLLAAGLVAGCAEMREPAPASRVPAGLGVPAADPVPAMVAETAATFGDAGRSLAGQPAATARGVGQLELVSEQLRQDPRWAPLPASVGAELRVARLEWRSALGIRSGAEPEAVARSLGRAALALAANDTHGAAAALDPAIFEPGGVPNVARLAAPGPLPQSAIATRVAREEVARLASLRLGGMAGALDPNAGALGLSVAPGLANW